MEIEVTKDSDITTPPASVAPPVVDEPITSRLSIRQQREEIVAKLYKDLIVPRWHITFDDGGTRDVVVRYKPVRAAKVEQSLKRRSGDENATDEAALLVHCDVLVDACVGVFQVLDGDYSKKYALRVDENGAPETEPTEFWTKFDKDLGKTLGMQDWEMALAAPIVRKLYITDGDLIDASNRVSQWSSEANRDAAEDFTTP